MMSRRHPLFCILRIFALSLLLPTFALGWRIHVLVRTNDVQKVALALRTEPALGFQINWQEDRDGLTPLEIAISLGNDEMVALLKQYGAVETPFESGSPASAKSARRRFMYDAEPVSRDVEQVADESSRDKSAIAPEPNGKASEGETGLFDLDLDN